MNNAAFKNGAKFECFLAIVPNPKCIHEEIENRLNQRNARYCSVQSLVSPI